MHDRYRRGIGVALAAFALLLGSTAGFGNSTLSTCRATFALSPSSGTAVRGGQKRISICGITRTDCTWQVSPTLVSPPAGITMTGGSFTLPAHKIAEGTATLNVGIGVPLGTYSLTIKLNLTRSLGTMSEAAPAQYFTFTLQVVP